MFNVTWQDPREAETVKQRRERKERAYEASIRSSRRSSVSNPQDDTPPLPHPLPPIIPVGLKKFKPFGVFRNKVSSPPEERYDEASHIKVTTTETTAGEPASSSPPWPTQPVSVKESSTIPIAGHASRNTELDTSPERPSNCDYFGRPHSPKHVLPKKQSFLRERTLSRDSHSSRTPQAPPRERNVMRGNFVIRDKPVPKDELVKEKLMPRDEPRKPHRKQRAASMTSPDKPCEETTNAKAPPIPIVGPYGDQAYSGMDTSYLVIRDEVSQQLADYFDHIKTLKTKPPMGSEIKVPLSAKFYTEQGNVRNVISASEKNQLPAHLLPPRNESASSLSTTLPPLNFSTTSLARRELTPPTRESSTFTPLNSYFSSHPSLPNTPPMTSASVSSHQPNALHRTLRKMETAPVGVLAKRLNEHWVATEPEMCDEIDFEKQLWALTALEYFNIRNPIQEAGDAGAVSLPIDVRITPSGNDDVKILYMHGEVADSWHLAVKNPSATINHLTFPSRESSSASALGTPPANLRQRGASPNITPFPYRSASQDLILTRSLPMAVRSTDWPPVLKDCIRVLKPGGWLAVSALDAMPRNAGPLLQHWISSNIMINLERKFRVTQPAALLPLWLADVAELTPAETVPFSFQAITSPQTMLEGYASGKGDIEDEQALARASSATEELRSAVGRHFYYSLYRDFVPENVTGLSNDEGKRQTWWWDDATIVAECQARGSEFSLMTYWCQKK
ncbi:MAG: hypothetical protein M1817_001449 [Caeruleum heppii]|nr:MAG: hypothetical protein M1817_001449 [Caeruleum heppii]